MTLTPLNWLLSFLPILCVIILMLGFKWGGTRAGAVGWAAAVLVSLVFFGLTWELIAYIQVKSFLLSLDVLYIVWGALLLYNVAQEAGAIRFVSDQIPRISSDPVLQVLLVAWLLTSFLQGMGGFGVPIAVCAPILVGMGYSPTKAVLLTALGHGWAVSFGSMATAFQALLAVTGVSGVLLAPFSATLLGIALIPTGVIIVVIAFGWKKVGHALPVIAFISLVMGSCMYFLAISGLWTMATTGAALLGLLCMLLLVRLPMYRKDDRSEGVASEKISLDTFLVMVSPYLVLMLIGFAFILIAPINAFLSRIGFSLMFPELVSKLGWVTPAQQSKTIHPFSHPGSVLLYSVLISSLIFHFKGVTKPGAARRILSGMLHSSLNASLGVLTMVGVATIMTHSGMTYLLAKGLSERISAAIYPGIVPFIGVLGAFITGSNNNSNVLFAQLQMETAKLLNLSIPLILSAQTAGGSLGSIMSPAKVIVGCSTVGLSKKEGLVLRSIVLYGMIPVILVAVVTVLWSYYLSGG